MNGTSGVSLFFGFFFFAHVKVNTQLLGTFDSKRIYCVCFLDVLCFVSLCIFQNSAFVTVNVILSCDGCACPCSANDVECFE